MEDMAVYIANLGKYNEGYLVGDWFTFPLDWEEIKERIGLNGEYEEYAIHDTDNFPCDVPEYISIDELNQMYELISELPEEILDELNEFIGHYGSLEEVHAHKEDICFFSDCGTMEDVARHYAEELNMLGDIPPELERYIDYEAYGRDLEVSGTFIETRYGMCEIIR